MFDRFHLRYLVPNGVTAANLILALTAIVQASRGRPETGAWLIVWCALFDRVDGVVARWLGASSEFGIQFDTLSDLLAFCVAPGLLVYLLLTGDPRYAPIYESAATKGILLISVGVYVLSGAIRLARFNVQAETIGTKWFRGLPVTIAGALVATFILASWELALPAEVAAASPFVLMMCSIFMLSNLWLPKSFEDEARIPLRYLCWVPRRFTDSASRASSRWRCWRARLHIRPWASFSAPQIDQVAEIDIGGHLSK